MLEAITAKAEAIAERALTVTELSVGADEGTVGHDEVQAAALSPKQKSRLADRVEARVAEDEKRLNGRARVARALVGGTAADGTPMLDADNPDHRAAVDDYFEDLVLPGFFETVLLPGNRDRIGGVAVFIAATAMMPKDAETLLTMSLGLPPDLGSEPKRGPGPAEQAASGLPLLIVLTLLPLNFLWWRWLGYLNEQPGAACPHPALRTRMT